MVHTLGVAEPLREGRRALDVDVPRWARRIRVYGLAVVVEIWFHHARGGGILASHTTFEVVGLTVELPLRFAEMEVAIDGRHVHPIAQLGLTAGPAGLGFAVLGATVAAAGVAVVAVFVEHDAV